MDRAYQGEKLGRAVPSPDYSNSAVAAPPLTMQSLIASSDTLHERVDIALKRVSLIANALDGSEAESPSTKEVPGENNMLGSLQQRLEAAYQAVEALHRHIGRIERRLGL